MAAYLSLSTSSSKLQSSEEAHIPHPSLMWDALLYMCCFYWLMNKAVLVSGLVEKSQAGNQNRDKEGVGRVKETPYIAEGEGH